MQRNAPDQEAYSLQQYKQFLCDYVSLYGPYRKPTRDSKLNQGIHFIEEAVGVEPTDNKLDDICNKAIDNIKAISNNHELIKCIIHLRNFGESAQELSRSSWLSQYSLLSFVVTPKESVLRQILNGAASQIIADFHNSLEYNETVKGFEESLEAAKLNIDHWVEKGQGEQHANQGYNLVVVELAKLGLDKHINEANRLHQLDHLVLPGEKTLQPLKRTDMSKPPIQYQPTYGDWVYAKYRGPELKEVSLEAFRKQSFLKIEETKVPHIEPKEIPSNPIPIPKPIDPEKRIQVPAGSPSNTGLYGMNQNKPNEEGKEKQEDLSELAGYKMKG